MENQGLALAEAADALSDEERIAAFEERVRLRAEEAAKKALLRAKAKEQNDRERKRRIEARWASLRANATVLPEPDSSPALTEAQQREQRARRWLHYSVGVPRQICNSDRARWERDCERFPDLAPFNAAIDNWDGQPLGLFLDGSVGLGKSRMVVAKLREIARDRDSSIVTSRNTVTRNPNKIAWFTVPDLARQLSGYWRKPEESQPRRGGLPLEAFVEKAVRSYDLVVFDDLGAEPESHAFMRVNVMGWIRYRIEDRRPLIVTSNGITSYINDERIARRVDEEGVCIDFDNQQEW